MNPFHPRRPANLLRFASDRRAWAGVGVLSWALWGAPATAQPATEEAKPTTADPVREPSSVDPPAPRPGLVCTPSARVVQTRRPIPIECHADAEVVQMTLRYQEHGGAEWQTLEMQRHGAGFRATIPCESTLDSGRLRFFVMALDSAGDPLDTLGSKGRPQLVTLNPQSSEAPAYPGEPPPARCAERVHCPPGFPGCVDPVTAAPREAGAGRDASPRHWLGLHFAADIGLVGGSNVCMTTNRQFDCFAAETPYPAELPAGVAAEPGELGDAYPGTGIDTGAAGGTVRALFSYDRALLERLAVGGRLGYAFGGGPETRAGHGFLPLHVEARLSYWLRGLKADGLRPYLHLGGGVAQVDLRKGDLTVRDCSEEGPRQAFLDCVEAQNAYAAGSDPALPTRTVDAYRKLGNAFITAGGGLLLPLGQRTALQLNLNAMLMLPDTGFVLQPALGVVYGL